MQIVSFSGLIRSARVPIQRESIVVPSPQSPPATITKGARMNIDNDDVLVFVRSRASGASVATDRIHRSFGTSELYRISSLVYRTMITTSNHISILSREDKDLLVDRQK